MRVLAIAAHPDDETFGCGGSLLRHVDAGDDVFWLIMTRPYEPKWTRDVIDRKVDEVRDVSSSYGFKKVFWLNHQSTRLDVVPQAELIEGMTEVAGQVKPQWVYVVNRGDIHSDHRSTFDACMATFKPFRTDFRATKILAYECLSSTDAAPPLRDGAFIPNMFADITPHIGRKIEIVGLYETETHADPLPRNESAVRALARYRGATIGVEFAEAFLVVREVVY